MAHLYFVGVFCVIFNGVMFFVNIASLMSYYETGQFTIPFYVIASGVSAPLMSFYLITTSVKLSVVNLKKIDYNLIDNENEGEKHHTVLPSYFNLFLAVTILLYTFVGYYCFNRIYLNHISLLDIDKLEVRETFFFGFLTLINLYYFIQILRINVMVKKYGVIKNKL